MNFNYFMINHFESYPTTLLLVWKKNITMLVTQSSLILLFSILISSVQSHEAGYFNSVKDAVDGLKSILNIGLNGLEKLAHTVQVIEQFVDATIEEDCEPFMCPKGILFYHINSF